MKQFFAAFLGCLFAIVLIVALTAGVGSCVGGKKVKIEDDSYLVIEMYGDLLEYDPPGGVMSAISGGDTETLQRILDNLAKAAADDRIDGVIFKLSFGAGIGNGSTHEIRNAIKRVQAAGKKVYAWAESFDEKQYFLMAACDEILAPPTAYIQFTGWARTSTHVKLALEKLGIKAEVHKIKDYKSAAELVMREDLSEPAKENTQWIYDGMWEAYVEALSTDRGLGDEQIVGLMERAAFSAEQAMEGGLLDRLLYWDELEAELKDEDEDELATVCPARYAEVEWSKLDLDGDKTIAVIHAQGAIAGRVNGVNPLLGITMGHETIIEQFRRARMDEDVAAIVFRIDSGGGDALGSDLMGHEVEVTARVKPVVASMVDVAASGGYHIAYRATKIVADPTTITGSIGSINGKFNMTGLYDKLGITHDFVTRGPNALMYSSYTDFTPEQWEIHTEEHWNGFNAWLRDVAEHRGMPFEEAEKLAHGRVWTGNQALANGLIDEVGDLNHAVELAKQLAEIPADEKVNLDHYPKKTGLFESIMGGDATASTAARWLVYRTIRNDFKQTVEMLSHNPELAAEALTP